MDALEQALSNAKNGHAVFPVNPLKTPYKGTRGFLEASDDPEQIATWFTQYPEAHVGLATGELVVLDIDVKNGKDGFTALDSHNIIIDAPDYRTRSGGGHVLYRANGEVLNNAADYQGMPGIDRRGYGGYVALPSDVVIAPVSELPVVPQWFTRGKDTVAATFDGSTQQWIDTVGAGVPDGLMRSLIGKGSLVGHNVMLSVQAHVIKVAGEGHPGGAVVLSALRDRWVSSDHASGDASDEWDTALRDGIAKFGAPTVDAPLLDDVTPTSDDTATDNPIKVLSLTDLRKRPKLNWWIDGLIQQSSIAVLAGFGGIGKSFVAGDMCFRIATGGMDFFGRKVNQGKVLYVAGEGVEDFIGRINGWEIHNGVKLNEDNFHLIESGVNLSDETANKYFIERVLEYEADFIVMDTFTQLSNIQSENDASQVSAVLKAALAIRRARPLTTVVLLHHATKTTGKSRGSSAMRDNCDTMISQRYMGEKTGGAFMLTTSTEHDGKQRNGKPVDIKGLMLTDVPGTSTAVVEQHKVVTVEYEVVNAVLADREPHSMTEMVTALRAASPDDELADAHALSERLKRGVLRPGIESGRYKTTGANSGLKYTLIQ